MSSENDEDDKQTVVLDMAEIQRRLAEDKGESTGSNEIEFEVSTDADEEITGDSSPLVSAPKVILFDYKSGLFEEQRASFPEGFEYLIAKDLAALNTHLKGKEEVIVFFNYGADSKAVNQLCTQINAKFKHVKTVIVAKNLSTDKVQVHKGTKAAANGYLSLPLESSAIEAEIKNIVG